MTAIKEELLADIESTVDLLVENAKILKEAKCHHHFEHEVDLLEKTQESLLARLMNRERQLSETKAKTLKSIKTETIQTQVVAYAKSLKSSTQKRARSRRARSKSSG